MSTVNKIILVGNLGQDPESRQVGEYTVCNFSIATSDGFGDRKRTTWHNIEVWGKTAESCMKYLTRGRKVSVDGTLLVDVYDGKDGNKVYKTFVKAQSVNFFPGDDRAGNKEEDVRESNSRGGSGRSSRRNRGNADVPVV